MGRAKDAGTPLAPVRVAVAAIVCCAELPLAGVLAGVTLATILGVGGGLIGLVAALAAMVLAVRAQRRSSCPPTTQGPTQ